MRFLIKTQLSGSGFIARNRLTRIPVVTGAQKGLLPLARRAASPIRPTYRLTTPINMAANPRTRDIASIISA
jgi:hypothetical protein